MLSVLLFMLAIVLVALQIWRFRRWTERVDLAVTELRARLDGLEARAAARLTPDAQRSPTVVVPPQPVSRSAQPPASMPPAAARTIPPAPATREVDAASNPAEAGSRESTAPRGSNAPALSAAMSAESLETAIGGRWLLYIGVVAVILGVGYFEKLAVDNQWIGEGARVLQGAGVGLVLVYAGLWFIRSGFPIYGQMIAGGGTAVQYVSVYAAFNFYHLIGRPFAFTLLCGVTMLAATLAGRQRSQGLALMAVGGGFITPFLLPGQTDAQLALFGYDTILIAGTMYLAHRRDWPLLNVVSYGLTVLTVLGWAAQFYAPSKYLMTELFLTLFCAMYLYILRESQRLSRFGADLSKLLWSAPVLYYLASIAILADHPAALLVYLLGLALAGAVVSLNVRGTLNSIVRLVLWIATSGQLIQWAGQHAGEDWLLAGLATVVGVYLIQLVAHVEATVWSDRRLNPAELAVLHLTGLGAFAAAYALVNAVNPDAAAPVAALLAAWQSALAFWLAPRDREHALHFAALGFTLLMIAIGLQFHGAWITMAWAAEGAAIVWLGLEERRDWLRAGGLVLLAISVARLFALQFAPRSPDQAVLLNQPTACGLFIIGLIYWLAWLHHRRNDTGQYAIEVGAGLVGAQLLTLSLATSEIDAYWAVRGATGAWSMARTGLQSMVWTAIGVTIAWLGLVWQQQWMRAVGGLLLTVAIGLVIWLQFARVPLTYVVMANSRVTSVVVVIALLVGLARLYRQYGQPQAATIPAFAVLVLTANALMLLLLTSEATAYWRLRDGLSTSAAGLNSMADGQFARDQFAREMTLSITWALYATGLIVAGIRKQYAPVRYLAIAIFGVTIGKVFLFDLPRLGEIYRVLSIIGLGIALLVTSYLYHRFRSRLQS